MSCLFCKGELTMSKVNHIVDLEDRTITVEDMPAEICIRCGEYFVHTKTALNLEEFLNN